MSIRSKVLNEIEKKPCRLRELKAKLGNDRKVQWAVAELIKRGKICQRNGTYYLTRAIRIQNALPCKLVKVGANFGFAQPLQQESKDVFVPGRALSGALPGDEVLVELFQRPRVPGSLEGGIVAVTNPRTRFVGTVTEAGGRLFLAPDDCPAVLLQIKKSAAGGVQEGDKAAVELLERGDDYADHRAGVTIRFGSSQDAYQCIRALCYEGGMSPWFSEEVRQEAQQLDQSLEEELAYRLDLRDWNIFTIDSAETKDIDDAISLCRKESGYELGVHIADVSHFVRPGSALDQEAFHRGASVYYGDTVLPMLPKQLSNNLCSLNEGEDRLAFSCIMQLDERAVVQSFRFEKTLIRSRVKGVYSEINALLSGEENPELEQKYQAVREQLPLMQEVYHKLLALRRERGYIDLESGEAKIVLDENGHCVDIQKRERGVSECVIEEFMLLANGCAANLARTHELPLVYRVHEAPELERAERLQLLLNACGVAASFAKPIPTQKELAALLESVDGKPCDRVVNQGVLRSMSKARYDAEPLGHFGLALADYAHFTSPIRRYPDLMVHRILSDWCRGKTAEQLQERYGDDAKQAALQSSTRENAIMQLERNADDCYKAEYIRGHLGEEFDGVISGVARQGIYVALDNLVEGLVRTESICKGEPQLTDGISLVDSLTGERWQLGQKVRVQVTGANVASRRVDFVLLSKTEQE